MLRGRAVGLLAGLAMTLAAPLETIISGAAAPRPAAPAAANKLLVAHRGASAYAPEHTLAAYQLALDQGADFVEQDLALTKDGVLICLHDSTLERTTNVEDVFPDRFIEDRSGPSPVRRWPVYDFTLAEIKKLDAGSWFDHKFAGARIITFQEAIDLVKGKAGLFPELKDPAVYRARGLAMEPLVVSTLRKNGLDHPAPGSGAIILQSFDEASLREMAKRIPDVPRILLMELDTGGHWLASESALRDLSTFATGIGPAKALVDQRPEVVRWAHAARLNVIPYTFRARSTGRFPTVREEMAHFLFSLDVDGLFTDNPDQFPRQPPKP
jgi:glycerophosphoryl diester phosphodiesterase